MFCQNCKDMFSQCPPPREFVGLASDSTHNYRHIALIFRKHTLSMLKQNQRVCSLCSRLYLAFSITGRLDSFRDSVLEITIDSRGDNRWIYLNAQTKGGPLFCTEISFRKPQSEDDKSFLKPPERDASRDLTMARRWLKNCEDTHSYCHSLRPLHPKLPMRLISVGSQDSEIRLCYSASISSESDLRYITLSHCWGKLLFINLKDSNHDEFLEKIPEQELTKTFKEAIHICRSLGISYIWIDSLCIIQDSLDGVDWKKEAATMHLVYSNSYLNLAASGSSDGTGGMFKDRNPALQEPCVISFPKAGEYFALDSELFKAEFEHSPLHSRGWVVQELFLAPRTLHFTNERQWWQCKVSILSDNSPKLSFSPLVLTPKWTYSNKVEEIVNFPRMSSDQVYSDWRRIVEDYSHSELTKASDRPVAITGLKEKFTQRFASAGKPQEYIAGHWTGYMTKELLWIGVRELIELPTSPIGPTWSWLSRNGPIYYGSFIFEPYEEYATFVTAKKVYQSAADSLNDNHWFALQIKGPSFQIFRDRRKNYYTFYQGSKFELSITFDLDRNLVGMTTCVGVVFQLRYYSHIDWYMGLVLEKQELNMFDTEDLPIYKRNGVFEIDGQFGIRNRKKGNVIFNDILMEHQKHLHCFWLY